mmetsp:Transcript_93871/g.218188  ORF Transcript_93871/g.218188 Transcript_93871/m.218188 type:complete len:284 (+) Transcript_93871:460-1311(+)
MGQGFLLWRKGLLLGLGRWGLWLCRRLLLKHRGLLLSLGCRGLRLGWGFLLWRRGLLLGLGRCGLWLCRRLLLRHQGLLLCLRCWGLKFARGVRLRRRRFLIYLCGWGLRLLRRWQLLLRHWWRRLCLSNSSNVSGRACGCWRRSLWPRWGLIVLNWWCLLSRRRPILEPPLRSTLAHVVRIVRAHDLPRRFPDIQPRFSKPLRKGVGVQLVVHHVLAIPAMLWLGLPPLDNLLRVKAAIPDGPTASELVLSHARLAKRVVVELPSEGPGVVLAKHCHRRLAA